MVSWRDKSIKTRSWLSLIWYRFEETKGKTNDPFTRSDCVQYTENCFRSVMPAKWWSSRNSSKVSRGFIRSDEEAEKSVAVSERITIDNVLQANITESLLFPRPTSLGLREAYNIISTAINFKCLVMLPLPLSFPSGSFQNLTDHFDLHSRFFITHHAF